MRRVYHPVSKWEEVAHNMWGDVPNKREALERSIEFTGDHKRYGMFMMRVIREWPFSCENALTDKNLNQKAWVGHAACALALGIPEDIVRKAWGMLSYEQRLLANREADRAIAEWRKSYRADRQLRENVGGQMLLF